MTPTLLICLIVIVAAIAFPFILIGSSNRQNDERRIIKNAEIALIRDFTASVEYRGNGAQAGFAIDAQRKKFAIYPYNRSPQIFLFEDLISVEAVRDGSAVTRVDRGSQLLGAAVGGALLGPVGLLLGGLTGSTRSVEKVKSLSLKIYTNDLMQPVNEVFFYYAVGEGVSPNSLTREAAELDVWYARFQTILRGQLAVG